MKNFFLCLLLILFTTATYCQIDKPLKFNTSLVTFYTKGDSKWEVKSKMDLEQIVVIDASNKKIKILDPVNTVEFDILNIENEILKGDIKKYPFNCVDDDGNKCIVEVILVKERFSTVRVKHDFVIMDLSAK